MAADSTKFEQDLSAKLIPKIEGLTPESKEQAKIIEEIIDITSKPKKDTLVSKSLPDEAFTNITKSEQPSFTGALTQAQKKIINPIGAYEGSVSQQYFVQPRFMRQAGDVDLHASTYGKAAKQVRDINKNIIADPGREFKAITSDKLKSAKIFSQSKSIESGEILYHGTDFKNATAILKKGFDLSKSKTSAKTIFTASHPEGAYGHKGNLLKVKMRKGAKAFDVNKQPDPMADDDLLRLTARKEGSDTIENLMQGIPSKGREVEIVSTKNILSIESLTGAKGKYITPVPKSKTGKVLEILNPEEVDEKGISQVLEGDTIFGKAIPKATYKVLEGKTYGRQRQILKKGESIYSIQKTGGKVELKPAVFRERKDTADFYALVKSAREIEFAGTKQGKRLDVLLSKFKKNVKFDIDDFLKKNNIPEPATLRVDRSTIQKIGSNQSVINSSKSLSSSFRPKSTGRSATSKIYGGRSSINSVTSKIPSTPSMLSKSASRMSSPPKSNIMKSAASIGSSTGKSLTGKSLTGKSLTGKSTGGKSSAGRSTGGKLTIIPGVTRRILPPVMIPWKHRTQKQKPTTYKPRVDFIGNTRVAEISGFRTKKTSIEYGKKTQRIFDEDLQKSKHRKKMIIGSSRKIRII